MGDVEVYIQNVHLQEAMAFLYRVLSVNVNHLMLVSMFENKLSKVKYDASEQHLSIVEAF